MLCADVTVVLLRMLIVLLVNVSEPLNVSNVLEATFSVKLMYSPVDSWTDIYGAFVNAGIIESVLPLSHCVA